MRVCECKHIWSCRLTSPILASCFKLQDWKQSTWSTFFLTSSTALFGSGFWSPWETVRSEAPVCCPGHPGQHTCRQMLTPISGNKAYLSVFVVREKGGNPVSKPVTLTCADTCTRTLTPFLMTLFPLLNYWISHLLIIFQSSMKPRQPFVAQH